MTKDRIKVVVKKEGGDYLITKENGEGLIYEIFYVSNLMSLKDLNVKIKDLIAHEDHDNKPEELRDRFKELDYWS